jgi:hypothetical protein
MSGSQLPNAIAATVADARVRDYLLDPTNPRNGGKAAFFQLFGFTQGAWQTLKAALRGHPLNNSVMTVTISPYGTMFEVRCNLQSPNGRNPCVRLFWIVDTASPNPKFVTAYPAAVPTTVLITATITVP